MKKRKNIAIPMILAATIAAVSVPCLAFDKCHIFPEYSPRFLA